MEEQQAGFTVTEDGIELLAEILDFASRAVAPDKDWEGGAVELAQDQQDTILLTAGAVLVEILQQVASGQEVAD